MRPELSHRIRTHRRQSGATLIEVLIVVAIAGIIAAGVATWAATTMRVQADTALTNRDTVGLSLLNSSMLTDVSTSMFATGSEGDFARAQSGAATTRDIADCPATTGDGAGGTPVLAAVTAAGERIVYSVVDNGRSFDIYRRTCKNDLAELRGRYPASTDPTITDDALGWVSGTIAETERLVAEGVSSADAYCLSYLDDQGAPAQSGSIDPDCRTVSMTVELQDGAKPAARVQATRRSDSYCLNPCAPIARFTSDPEAPLRGVPVVFDGSSSYDRNPENYIGDLADPEAEPDINTRFEYYWVVQNSDQWEAARLEGASCTFDEWQKFAPGGTNAAHFTSVSSGMVFPDTGAGQPEFSFAELGTHYVTLMVRNQVGVDNSADPRGHGCTSTAYTVDGPEPFVKIASPTPNATFRVARGKTTEFVGYAGSRDLGGTIDRARSEWRFATADPETFTFDETDFVTLGDLSNCAATPPQVPGVKDCVRSVVDFAFPDVGTFIMELRVWDNHGNFNSTRRVVVVSPNIIYVSRTHGRDFPPEDSIYDACGQLEPEYLPCRSIERAIEVAKVEGRTDVHVAKGTYAGFDMTSGIDVTGGWNDDGGEGNRNWQPVADFMATPTIVEGVETQGANGFRSSITFTGVNNTKIERLWIQPGAVTQNEIPLQSIRLDNSKNIRIVNVRTNGQGENGLGGIGSGTGRDATGVFLTNGSSATITDSNINSGSPAAPPSGEVAHRSAYGIRAVGNSTVTVVGGVISAQAGLTGVRGAPAPSLTGAQLVGCDGAEGSPRSRSTVPACVGEGGRNGTTGGGGGDGAIFWGSSGGQAGGSAPGLNNGGRGGSKTSTCFGIGSAGAGGRGRAGNPGAPGQPNAPGALDNFPASTDSGWVPRQSTAGGAGGNGRAGGGGGGGGGIDLCGGLDGASGGGGGGGGTGGLGGGGGYGGGGSFGIYNDGGDTTVTGAVLRPSAGGRGGVGGAGGTGGTGGNGGNGIMQAVDGSSSGGAGGGGGGGGAGGAGGATGPSVGVYSTVKMPVVTADFEPNIGNAQSAFGGNAGVGGQGGNPGGRTPGGSFFDKLSDLTAVGEDGERGSNGQPGSQGARGQAALMCRILTDADLANYAANPAGQDLCNNSTVLSLRRDTNPANPAINHSPTNATSVSWRLVFKDPVSGVTPANFALVRDGVTVSSQVTVAAVPGGAPSREWIITAGVIGLETAGENGTLGLDLVNVDGIRDAQNIDLERPSQLPFVGDEFVVDQTAPRVTGIERVSGQLTNSSSLSWYVKFSEPVSGDYLDVGTVIDANAFVVGPEALRGAGGYAIENREPMDASRTVWLVTVTLEGRDNFEDGQAGLELRRGFDFIQDDAGNALTNEAVIGDEYNLDRTPPTIVSITRDAATPAETNQQNVGFNVVFSEPVTYPKIGDPAAYVDAFEAVAQAVSATGITATVDTSLITEVNPTTFNIKVRVQNGGVGNVGLQARPEDYIRDLVGNPLDRSVAPTTNETVFVDREAPRLVRVERSPVSTDPGPTNGESVAWRVTFHETATGVTAARFGARFNGAASPVNASGITVTDLGTAGNGENSFLVVMPTPAGAGLLGTYELVLASPDGIVDRFGNDMGDAVVPIAPSPNQTYLLDRIKPSDVTVVGTYDTLWTNRDDLAAVPVRIEARDNNPGGQSGVAEVWYYATNSWNGTSQPSLGDFTEADGVTGVGGPIAQFEIDLPFTEVGEWTIWYYAVDAAGNMSDTQRSGPFKFRIDKGIPEVAIASAGDGYLSTTATTYGLETPYGGSIAGTAIDPAADTNGDGTPDGNRSGFLDNKIRVYLKHVESNRYWYTDTNGVGGWSATEAFVEAPLVGTQVEGAVVDGTWQLPFDFPLGGTWEIRAVATDLATNSASSPTLTFRVDTAASSWLYVSTATGNDSWTGLCPTNVSGNCGPKKTISSAIAAANTAGTAILVSNGTYGEVVVANKTQVAMIRGGYDATTWKRRPAPTDAQATNAAYATLITGNASHATPGYRSTAVHIVGSGTDLEQLTATAPDATAAGESSYGVRVEGAGDVRIVNSRITAGNGAVGTAGASPSTPGFLGGTGGPGGACVGCGGGPGGGGQPVPTPGGAGGSGGLAAGSGNGGSGGGGLAAGGVAGRFADVTAPTWSGASGGDGTNGAGGGGGGGGAASSGSTWANGGAGGKGGDGGAGGRGGGPGGGSFGVYSYNTNVTVSGTTRIAAGNGAVGGKGGDGATGAVGANGSNASCATTASGPGGGGGGGAGGAGGGGGAGGPSIGFYQVGTSGSTTVGGSAVLAAGTAGTASARGAGGAGGIGGTGGAPCSGTVRQNGAPGATNSVGNEGAIGVAAPFRDSNAALNDTTPPPAPTITVAPSHLNASTINNDVTITISADDAESGIERLDQRLAKAIVGINAAGQCDWSTVYQGWNETWQTPNNNWQVIDNEPKVSGRCYAYRIRVTDRKGNVSGYSGNPGVIVDTVAPSGGTFTYASGAVGGTSAAALITLPNSSAGLVDTSGAGLNGSGLGAGRLERRSRGVAGTSCSGTWGAWSTIASPAANTPTYSDAFPAGQASCYQYRYSVVDVAGNRSADYTSANEVRVDTIAPPGGSITVETGDRLYSGEAPPAMQVSVTPSAECQNPADCVRVVERQSAPLSGAACGAFTADGSVTITGTSLTDDGTLAWGPALDRRCYRFAYVERDALNNASVANTSGNVRMIDTANPAPFTAALGLTIPSHDVNNLVYARTAGVAMPGETALPTSFNGVVAGSGANPTVTVTVQRLANGQYCNASGACGSATPVSLAATIGGTAPARTWSLAYGSANFTNAGSYRVTVVAVDAGGNRTTTARTIHVDLDPKRTVFLSDGSGDDRNDGFCGTSSGLDQTCATTGRPGPVRTLGAALGLVSAQRPFIAIEATTSAEGYTTPASTKANGGFPITVLGRFNSTTWLRGTNGTQFIVRGLALNVRENVSITIRGIQAYIGASRSPVVSGVSGLDAPSANQTNVTVPLFDAFGQRTPLTYPGGHTGNFSVRYTRTFTPAASVSDFGLRICASGGSRVFVTGFDGVRRLLSGENRWSGSACYFTNAIDLVAGQQYTFEIEGYGVVGSANMGVEQVTLPAGTAVPPANWVVPTGGWLAEWFADQPAGARAGEWTRAGAGAVITESGVTVNN